MSNQNTTLKSGIRDNLRRGTVYEFLEQEIKNGSVLSIVSAYFTINAFEALQKPLNEIENLRFLFGDPDFIKSLQTLPRFRLRTQVIPDSKQYLRRRHPTRSMSDRQTTLLYLARN